MEVVIRTRLLKTLLIIPLKVIQLQVQLVMADLAGNEGIGYNTINNTDKKEILLKKFFNISTLLYKCT